jgi:hypothetical protein
MWPFSQWITAGRAALIYITVGVFTVIWTGVWYGYLYNNPPTGSAYYWCTGFLVTGLTMVLIGLVLAKVSCSARNVRLPAAGDPVALVNVQPNAATPPAPVLVPRSSASPAIASNAQVVLAPPSLSGR